MKIVSQRDMKQTWILRSLHYTFSKVCWFYSQIVESLTFIERAIPPTTCLQEKNHDFLIFLMI